MVFLFALITFDPILDDIFRFWTNSGIQDGGQRWTPFRKITQILSHMMSSPHDADVEGDIF